MIYKVLITHYHLITMLNPKRPHRHVYMCYHGYTCNRGSFTAKKHLEP